jgi:hypothetical protein
MRGGKPASQWRCNEGPSRREDHESTGAVRGTGGDIDGRHRSTGIGQGRHCRTSRARGSKGGILIEAPDTDGLWESGIDVAGGLDDTRADSVEGLGLSPADLRPRYLVTYRFYGDDLIRQELYPYAKGGPVTYTSPGQEVTAGITMQITAGWYQSSLGFFQYLVDYGLPERNPVAPIGTDEAGPDTAPWARTVLWAGIVVVLVGLAALALATLVVRHRERAVGRVNR